MSANTPLEPALTVLIGTVKGLFCYHGDKSRKKWKLTGPYLAGSEISSVCGDPRSNRIIVGTEEWGAGPTVKISEDDGATWTQARGDPSFAEGSAAKLNHLWQIVPGHSSQPGTWYAGSDDAALFVSKDDGATWSEVVGLTNHPTRSRWVPGFGGLCLHSIVVDPQSADRLWVGISAVGVFRSEDGGVSWDMCNEGLPNVAPEFIKDPDMGRCVHKLALDPSVPGGLVMQFHGGVYRSVDGGDSWQSIGDGLAHQFGFPLAVTERDLFVVPLMSDHYRVVPDGAFKVWRSSDRGRVWRALTKGLPQQDCFVGVLRDAMATDGLSPAGLFLGTTGGEVFISTDDGESWQQQGARLPRITVVKTWIR